MQSFAWNTFVLLALGSLVHAQTPTSCTVSAITPSPTGYICRQQGTVQSPGIIRTTTSPDVATCRDLCLNDQPECISFSRGPGNRCVLYNKKVIQSNFKPSRSSGSTFWNRNCFKRTCGLCPEGLVACNGQCVDPASFQNDSNNCGSCGNKCDANRGSCSGGQCQCRDQTVLCGGTNSCCVQGESCQPGGGCACATTPDAYSCGDGYTCIPNRNDANNEGKFDCQHDRCCYKPPPQELTGFDGIMFEQTHDTYGFTRDRNTGRQEACGIYTAHANGDQSNPQNPVSDCAGYASDSDHNGGQPRPFNVYYVLGPDDGLWCCYTFDPSVPDVYLPNSGAGESYGYNPT